MNIINLKNSKWFVLFSMIVCLSLIFLDQTVVPVALQNIKQTVHATLIQLQWVLNAYLLTLASLIIIGGKLADLLGNKKIFNFGMSLFAIGSILCAVSTHIIFLIISRGIQGIGAAFMLPTSGVLIINAFGFEERGKAMGIYIAIASIFLALGPMIGGIITQHFGWQWIFWINIPLIIVSVFVLYLSKIKEFKQVTNLKKIDWYGFIWLILTIVPFIFSLMESSIFGWNSPIILMLIILSVFSLVVFIITEQKKQFPLLDIKLFKNIMFRVSILLIMFTQITIIAIAFWPMFIEHIFKFTPQQAGYLILFVTVPVMIISPMAGKLMDNHGPRLPITLGYACIGVGALWISIVIWLQNYLLILPGFFIYGCGPSFLISPTMTYIMNTVDPKMRGTVAGVASFFRQLGGALGLALIGAIISHVYLIKTSNLFNNVIVYNGDYSSVFAFSISTFIIFLFAVTGIFLLKFLPNYENVNLLEHN